MTKFTPPTIPGLKIEFHSVKDGKKLLFESYDAYVGKYIVFSVRRDFLYGKNPKWVGDLRIPHDKEISIPETVIEMKEPSAQAFYALADAAAQVTLPMMAKLKLIPKDRVDMVAKAVAKLRSAEPKTSKKVAKKAPAKKSPKKTAKKTRRK